MRRMDRRTLLCGIAIGVLAASGRCPIARGFPSKQPPPGVLTRLPGNGNQLALTIDDGASVQVVGAFADFCRDSGTRLTFFVNGANSSWSVDAPALRPMVDSGQVQLGNHTWSHPDITRIAPAAVADQIRRNADFLRNTYGVDGSPYFRPPWGRHTPVTDRIAADLGYTTIALWSGDIGDSGRISEAGLIAAASRSFQPQAIVVGHANLPTITHCFPQLLDLIRGRNLQTVTLNDVFS
jgi:peptidoglycan/xylan/chitin deacetylase (PgdA/CDA1 family)